MFSRLKPETLEDDLDKYAASAMKMKKEKIDLKEFSAYLEFPVSHTLESMFALFDEVRNYIRFKNHTTFGKLCFSQILFQLNSLRFDLGQCQVLLSTSQHLPSAFPFQQGKSSYHQLNKVLIQVEVKRNISWTKLIFFLDAKYEEEERCVQAKPLLQLVATECNAY